MSQSADFELETFYRTLAPYYDLIYGNLGAGEDIAFYREIATASPGPVLEMGCGTGRVLLPLARAGVSMWGMDSSLAMLEQLCAALKGQDAILSLSTPLGELNAPQGWIAADVTISGSTFTVVETHLQSMIPGHPEVAQLQVLQAQELASADFGTHPVVIAGDFNSNATHTPPEHTQSVAVMESAGYIDTWRAANHGNPGFTWPLYLEDPLRTYPNGPFERIDFIFQRGLAIQSVDRIGWKAPHASDHAGVVATLSF